MPSSGSTRSPSADRSVPLYLWVAGDDHPKACTGRRLLRAGAALPVAPAPFRGLLLDPHSPVPLSRGDRGLARGGIAAVDCSWNRLGERGGYPAGPFDRVADRQRRRLPWMLAGNPQHFGRLGELNTAEALAAALWVLGRTGQARRVLDVVGAGDSFPSLNGELLSDYSLARGPTGIRRVEQDYFGPG
ncbi:MAG TPA: DUF367 domain-containing protein [Thermoplasmata archaeon]|nr:DUF367 domain-containing protein [Thermoplasmata archaeon]